MARGIAKVPQVMQMEALECGAACLAMVLAHYGLWVPLEQVRADCGVSRDGSRATNVLKAARSYGLQAKGLSISTKALQKRNDVPCILFWNFNHFVVLAGFKGKYAYINDPARGQVKVPMEEFENSFTGVALVFKPTEAFQKGGKAPDAVGYARGRLAGLGPTMAFVMLSAAVVSLASIASLSLGKVFLDSILPGVNPDWLLPLLGIMLVLALVGFAAQVVNALSMVRIEGKLTVVSSSRFIRHLLHLPVEFYSQRMVGDLLQRQTANETIAITLMSQLAPLLVNSVMLVFYLVVMLRYSVVLTLVGIATVVLNVFTARYISKKRLNISRAMAADTGKFYASTVGGIEMIETIKAAGAENGYFRRWAGLQAKVNEGMVGLERVSQYLGAIPALLTQLANIAVLVLGVWLIVAGSFTPGALMAFQGFLSAFMAPVAGIIALGQTVQEMQTNMERVNDVMRYEPDVPDEFDNADEYEAGKGGAGKGKAAADKAAADKGTEDKAAADKAAEAGEKAGEETGEEAGEGAAPKTGEEGAGEGEATEATDPTVAPAEIPSAALVLASEKLRGQVDLEGVTFGYSPLEPPLIEDFNLHLEPGQWVALVGGSGCGKSTIAKLMSGLYKPWAGQVKFDGIPIADVPRPILRGSLAVVDQDIITFDDTVSDNVKLWDRSIEDYEVILACRDAGIHETIIEREGGYGSRIMPGGRNFSGGQLQRLEIARVLAQDPTVIILDEATSALDAQTEADVIARIRERGITCVVVAHRLSTIRDCDEIIVLEDGKVVERGTHAQLLAADGAYAELVRND